MSAKAMTSVGQIVQEAIDLMNRGSYEQAFVPTVRAIEDTIKRSAEKDAVSDADYERFLKENWQLITFMGMPRALPLPMNIPFGLKRIVSTFNVHHGALEIVALAIMETQKFGKMPDEFAINTAGKFEIVKGRLLLPIGLVSGLLGSVIFHPSSKGETIGDEYWISISDFKMFVSELFGRKDLADRILKFYLN